LKTLHLYLTRQVLAALVMTVAVFTFVLLLGNALRDILPLLISGQVNPIMLLRATGHLLPFILVFALPMGMLTATLLVFGRFSADQELTAVRASGISLLSVSAPLIVLSLLLCGLSAYVNMEIGPRGRVAYKELIAELKGEMASVFQLPEGRFLKDKNYVFYIGKSRRGQLEDVTVFGFKNETNVDMTVRASTGTYSFDRTNKVVHLTLYDGKFVSLGDNEGLGTFESYPLVLDYNPERQQGRKAKIDDLTFAELRQELRDLDRVLPIEPSVKLDATQLKEKRLEFEKQKKNWESLLRFQAHRQVAFSFACFGFTLLGIPLGIRMHRRETNVGIMVALALVAIYYSFILIGQSLVNRPEFAPHLLVWIPNFLFQAIGAVLLWKANRG
jgi:lipopolysaccharide export system permease protein